MDTIEVSLRGHPDDASELVRAARAAGLEASSGGLILNTGVPPEAATAVILGTLAAVTRVINAFLRERKRRLEIIRPDIHIYAENYTDEELAAILKKGGHIGIKTLKKDAG